MRSSPTHQIAKHALQGFILGSEAGEADIQVVCQAGDEAAQSGQVRCLHVESLVLDSDAEHQVVIEESSSELASLI